MNIDLLKQVRDSSKWNTSLFLFLGGRPSNYKLTTFPAVTRILNNKCYNIALLEIIVIFVVWKSSKNNIILQFFQYWPGKKVLKKPNSIICSVFLRNKWLNRIFLKKWQMVVIQSLMNLSNHRAQCTCSRLVKVTLSFMTFHILANTPPTHKILVILSAKLPGIVEKLFILFKLKGPLP